MEALSNIANKFGNFVGGTIENVQRQNSPEYAQQQQELTQTVEKISQIALAVLVASSVIAVAGLFSASLLGIAVGLTGVYFGGNAYKISQNALPLIKNPLQDQIGSVVWDALTRQPPEVVHERCRQRMVTALFKDTFYFNWAASYLR